MCDKHFSKHSSLEKLLLGAKSLACSILSASAYPREDLRGMAYQLEDCMLVQRPHSVICDDNKDQI